MSNLRRRVMGGGDDTYGYIILDQSQTDPTLKIVDMSGRTYATGYRTPRVIETIRKMSHCYVGTPGGDVLYLKQLDDNDHTMYADGTSAATDITQKNVFMRLPYFFTRATEITSASNLTPSSGSTIWMIEFFIDKKQTSASTVQPAGNGWKQWGGNDLIGKYKGNCSDTSNNTSGTLRSISAVTPSVSISLSNFKTKARNNGSGFTCVKLKHQNIMAILFYGYYGHTNAQLICGSGYDSNQKTTGLKNSKGMSDTTSLDGNTSNVSFWGLENWWGDTFECFDNVSYKTGTVTITEDNSSTRTVSTKNGSEWVYPIKWVIGDNLDIISPSGQNNTNENDGYCDGLYLYGLSSQYNVARSGNGNHPTGGVGTFFANPDVNNGAAGIGSRLAYNGNILDVNNIEYVDLGLPSGLKWATCNLGARQPTDAGMYFSWGNVVGHIQTGSGYNFSQANYNNSPGSNLGAQNIPVNSSYDAAQYMLGGKWRLPTKAEGQELIDNTINELGTLNGVNGMFFYKKDGNGQKIINTYVFFPFVGGYEGTQPDGAGTYAFGWTSSYKDSKTSWYLRLSSSVVDVNNYLKYLGFPIRPVYDPILL